MDTNAHDDVLALCRANAWVMRNAPENPMSGYEWSHKHRVFNLNRYATAPNREIVAQGDSWEEVLTALKGEAWSA